MRRISDCVEWLFRRRALSSKSSSDAVLSFNATGVPAFHVLENRGPRVSALLTGATCEFALLVGLCFAFSYEVPRSSRDPVADTSNRTTHEGVTSGGSPEVRKPDDWEAYEIPMNRRSISVPREILQRYVGTYVGHSSTSINISILLDHDQLYIEVAGRRATLIPVSMTTFIVDGRPDCWVEFVASNAGVVNQLVISESGNQTTAHRP